MPDTPATITAWLNARLETYREELRQLCAFECPTASKPGVDAAGAWVRSWAVARGWPVQTWADPHVGDSVIVRIAGGDPQGVRAMLVAHLDTVYPVGVAASRPLRAEGPKLLGPGSCDNKSGLLSALYAAAALEDLGLLSGIAQLTIICGGDEETDMRSSGALLSELAPQHDFGLVLEAGRENGDIVGARKGAGHWTLEVRGKAAHAGVEPHKGANAILALAQQIVGLQLVNGVRPGVTVNVGVVSGGTVSNAVADYARAEIDARVIVAEDMAPAEAAIRQVAEHPAVLGTSATLSGGWAAPPMAQTAQIAALAETAVACAAELGFTTRAAATGGVSYANHLAAAGLPVLDGLGPVGGLDHSSDEYILTESIVPRTALLALLLLRARR